MPDDYTISREVSVRGMTETTNLSSLYCVLTDVLRVQFGVMQEQIPGLVSGRDPDTLHDFRVAARRSRAALSQMKPALRAADVSSLMTHYRVLAGVTNRLRDLDVFACDLPVYEQRLPEIDRQACRAYRRRILRRRNRETRKVKTFFHSEECSIKMAYLHRKLTGSDALPPGKQGRTPAERFARKAVNIRYLKVRDTGVSLLQTASSAGASIPGGEPPDRALHAMRIQFKKLRYLIEFFKPFSETAVTQALIKRMKRFQDILGAYNDARIQSEMIDSDTQLYRRSVALSSGIPDTLRVLLEQKKISNFETFRRVFGDFSAPATEELFRKVYGT
jgi:CHAD domain-containing protein